MYLANQSTTQVYSPFGSYVVEQHDNGFEGRRCYEAKTATSLKGTGTTAFEVIEVPAKRKAGDLLSSDQAAVALSLQRYYQIHSVGPTPARLQMLLNEVMGRVEPNVR